MQSQKQQFYFMLCTVGFICMLLLSYKNTNVLYEQFYSALSLVSGICMLRVSSNNNQIKNKS